MKKKMCYFLCLLMVASAMFVMTACSDDTGEPQEATETTGQPPITEPENDGLYKEAVTGNFLIEYPSSWKAESKGDMIYASESGAEEVPFISAEEIGWIGAPDQFITNQMTAFSDEYLNRVATQPEQTTMDVAGNTLKGFSASYSSYDGTATITRHEFVEVVDDVAYHFVCEYISRAPAGQHEDETTYFEFMNAIESMKIKAE